MNISKTTEFCVNLEMIVLVFMCACQYHCVKQPPDKMQLRIAKIFKIKHQLLQNTNESLTTMHSKIKVPISGNFTTLFHLWKQLQTVTDTTIEYNTGKEDKKRHYKGIHKRNTDKQGMEKQTSRRIKKTQRKIVPTSQCYICKGGTDVVSSIAALNLTDKYDGKLYPMF